MTETASPCGMSADKGHGLTIAGLHLNDMTYGTAARHKKSFPQRTPPDRRLMPVFSARSVQRLFSLNISPYIQISGFHIYTHRRGSKSCTIFKKILKNFSTDFQRSARLILSKRCIGVISRRWLCPDPEFRQTPFPLPAFQHAAQNGEEYISHDPKYSDSSRNIPLLLPPIPLEPPWRYPS